MRLFLNNIAIGIFPERPDGDLLSYRLVDMPDLAHPDMISGKIMLRNPAINEVKNLLGRVVAGQLPMLEEMVILSHSSEQIKSAVKKDFRIVKAAGGLVVKDDKFLLIQRLGKWDLPKGKLEKGEKMREAAIREVEEECGIKVRRREKICNTWHNYNLGDSPVLKKTAWYLMECLDDRKMKPQKEEGIEELKWMSRDEAEKAIGDSYNSIRTVFRIFLESLREEEMSVANKKREILILNGPNLNRLGLRNPELYGNRSFEEYIPELQATFPQIEFRYFQSNHEGDLIDFLQQETATADGIVINGGGLSHTSVSLADALADTRLPAVEVHISDVYKRESFRHHSFLKGMCLNQIVGKGLEGYARAVSTLLLHWKKGKAKVEAPRY
jgi:3-dehydroquinate dehydratase type II